MPLLQHYNLHQVILEKYGRNALIKYRRAESKTAALAKWRNHLHFNLSCKRFNVEPLTILGSSAIKGEQADKILAAARRKLLRVRIGQTKKTVNAIQADLNAARTAFRFCVDEETYPATLFLLHRKGVRTFERWRDRQKQKLNCLIAEKTITGSRPGSTTATRSGAEEATQKWVVNASSRTLTSAENAILTKGLSFAPTPKQPPVEEFIVAVESAARIVGTESEEAAVIRSKATSLLSEESSQMPNKIRHPT